MARCRTSSLLQGVFTPLEPCIFLVRHPAVGKGPLTCEDMTRCEYVSVDPGSAKSLLCSVNDAINVYLVLPAPTLTAGFPGLRCLSRMTLAFRPPPDYGSGGWGFESLAART
jgi:hypothetical protein